MSEKESKITKAAKTMANAGASKGGIARAAALTPERRVEIAKIANRARNRDKTKENNE